MWCRVFVLLIKPVAFLYLFSHFHHHRHCGVVLLCKIILDMLRFSWITDNLLKNVTTITPAGTHREAQYRPPTPSMQTKLMRVVLVLKLFTMT